MLRQIARCYSSLAGRKALVTGSAQGVGLGIVETFLENGIEEVVVHDIVEPKEMFEAIEELKGSYDHSPNIHYIATDVRDSKNCRNLVRDSISLMGGLDILVNNAGIQRINPIEDFLDADWDDIIATNLSSCFFTISEAVKHWRGLEEESSERIWGRIINISSVHGVVASVHKAGYISAKHGLVGLTKVVALELAETTDITCNSICPGWIRTELAELQVERLAEERGIGFEEAEVLLVSEKQPKPKFCTTQDIGNIALFLCSDSADNITGSSQVIDGGWSAQ